MEEWTAEEFFQALRRTWSPSGTVLQTIQAVPGKAPNESSLGGGHQGRLRTVPCATETGTTELYRGITQSDAAVPKQHDCRLQWQFPYFSSSTPYQAAATLKPEPTQHNILDRLQTRK